MVKNILLKKKRRNDEGPDPTQGNQNVPGVEDLQACIALRAYALYEQGACYHGHDLDHWLQAEQEILGSEPKR